MPTRASRCAGSSNTTRRPTSCRAAATCSSAWRPFFPRLPFGRGAEAMSLVRTTLSVAMAATDTSMVVASATGVSAGYYVKVDQEVMRVGSAYVSGTTVPVIRGQDGTYVQAHPITAGVVVGAGSDW